MSLLEVSHLKKSFNGKAALDDLSFGVDAGEIFGLLGPNGAGKSTAMMAVAGLLLADAGSVRIEGQSLNGAHRQQRLILGLVPQELAVYPDLTGRENLEFFASIYGVRGPRLRQRVDGVVEQIGLAEHARRYVREYSGGMKRRLNFGAGLLHEPRLLILDEPTVGVDPQSRAHLLDSVQELAGRGIAVIYASHYMEEVEAICHRVAIIDRGKLLKMGTREELLEAQYSSIDVRVAAAESSLHDRVAGLAEVHPLSERECQVVVRRDRGGDAATIKRLSTVLDRLAGAQAGLLAIETRKHNLEQVFLDLTGRTLRE